MEFLLRYLASSPGSNRNASHIFSLSEKKLLSLATGPFIEMDRTARISKFVKNLIKMFKHRFDEGNKYLSILTILFLHTTILDFRRVRRLTKGPVPGMDIYKMIKIDINHNVFFKCT